MGARNKLRDRIESDLARRLAILGAEHRAAIEQLMGDAHEPRNVRDRHWHSMAREIKRELFWPLIDCATRSASGQWREFGSPDLGDDGAPLAPEERPGREGVDLPPLTRGVDRELRQWCDRRAAAVAASMVDTTRKALESLRSDLRRQPLQERDPEAKLRPRRKKDASGARTLFSRQPQYAALLDQLYGDGRWRLIAETETTGSVVAGEIAILRTLEKNRGWKFDMLWKTRVDERRCPICRPLHNKHRSFFARRVGFPPAHPRCRCYCSYQVLYKPPGSPAVSRKAATKMPQIVPRGKPIARKPRKREAVISGAAS